VQLAERRGDFTGRLSGTADLYTRLVQTHQKNRWFLNELLQKRDGLVS
jgi:DNA-binding ferritin-like protein